jgi:hypothetical protein
LNGLWFFTEWSLNFKEATFFFNMCFSLGQRSIFTIMANETILEESQKSVILMTLLYGNSSPDIWLENSTSQNIHV